MASLPKVYSFHHYLSLSVGYAIGLGWIIIPARMFIRGGSLGTLLAIVFSSALLFFVAKCYAQLVSTQPHTGGEVIFAQRAFGRATSFFIFWILCLGFLSYLPFYTSFTGFIFESLVPEAKSSTLYSLWGSDFRLSSILSGLGMGFFVVSINYHSTKLAINVQSIATALLLACVSIVAVIAIFNGDLSNLKPIFSGDGTPLESIELTGIVMGMICWYLLGFSTIAQTAGESKNENTRRML